MTLGNKNNEPIIQVRNISKKYNIGMDKTYKTFSESFTNAIRNPLKSLQRVGYQHDTFWALKDINFDVNRGEVVGIIGSNGAGKSTLLKILSRITTPTEGEIHLKGRVGSLLEVGTGFHPELTGRENIYFNGAILGMKKKEIDDKFDEIVKFSGVEKFLDTPVKRYSSGMQVRLAFSVAANLDPEILVVDEVLAVGDAQFQKKCLGKMGEVADSGRTVLFVSHNMNAVASLCKRVIVLKNGIIDLDSPDIRTGINHYLLESGNEVNNFYWEEQDKQIKNMYFSPTRFYISDGNGQPISKNGLDLDDLWIQIEGIISEIDPALQVGYALYSEDNILIYMSTFNDGKETDWPDLSEGKIRFSTPFPNCQLNNGLYRLELVVSLYCREWIYKPEFNSPRIFLSIGKSSDSPYWSVGRPGILVPETNWCTNKI